MDALTEHFGTTCVAGMKNAVLGMDDRTVELQQEFNALVSQYQQIYGGALVELDGKQLTIPQLGPYKEDLDPAVRRAAYEAEAGYFDAHRDELDAYNAAVRYFKVHLEGTKYSTKKLNEERTQLAGEVAEYRERLSAVQEDVKILRDVRHWLNQVLPSEQYRQTAEPGKKPSIQQAVKGRAQRIQEEQAEKRQQPRTEKKQDMEL